jgi:hypothetical protein
MADIAVKPKWHTRGYASFFLFFLKFKRPLQQERGTVRPDPGHAQASVAASASEPLSWRLGMRLRAAGFAPAGCPLRLGRPPPPPPRAQYRRRAAYMSRCVPGWEAQQSKRAGPPGRAAQGAAPSPSYWYYWGLCDCPMPAAPTHPPAPPGSSLAGLYTHLFPPIYRPAVVSACAAAVADNMLIKSVQLSNW